MKLPTTREKVTKYHVITITTLGTIADSCRYHRKMQLMFAFVVCLGLIGSSVLAAPPCDVNGCTYDTAEEGVFTIRFNSSGYFPACIRVTAGDDVTFTGSFATFPLSSGYLGTSNI